MVEFLIEVPDREAKKSLDAFLEGKGPGDPEFMANNDIENFKELYERAFNPRFSQADHAEALRYLPVHSGIIYDRETSIPGYRSAYRTVARLIERIEVPKNFAKTKSPIYVVEKI